MDFHYQNYLYIHYLYVYMHKVIFIHVCHFAVYNGLRFSLLGIIGHSTHTSPPLLPIICIYRLSINQSCVSWFVSIPTSYSFLSSFPFLYPPPPFPPPPTLCLIFVKLSRLFSHKVSSIAGSRSFRIHLSVFFGVVWM